MSPLEVSNWEMGCSLVFAFTLMGLSGYATLQLDRFVRRKGHQSPHRATLMVLGYAGTVGLAFFLGLGPEASYSPASHPEYFQPQLIGSHVWLFVCRFVLGTAIGLGVLALGAWAVPRKARRAGSRRVRFPWQTVAYVALGLVPASFLAAWLTDLRWTNAYKLAVLFGAAYVGAADLARRKRSRGLDETLQDDTRAPILYLRAFEGEDAAFAWLTYDEARALEIPMPTLTSRYHAATLERYLAQAIKAQLGPFVALGDPEDYLPPAGADRKYFADEEWLDAFKGLAKRAKVILMRPQSSSNLLIELNWLSDSDQLSKLFILTAPAMPGWKIYNWWWTRREQRAWAGLAADLTGLGIHVGGYPGDGALVTFDAQRNSRQLAAANRTPTDYVAPMASVAQLADDFDDVACRPT